MQAPQAVVNKFAVELARRILNKENIVFIDETSVNMWMRIRMTYSTREEPVKLPLNKIRGQGVTIYGAIGTQLPEFVHMIANTTNEAHSAEFLRRIRMAYPWRQRPKIAVVLDNHPAHKTDTIKVLARNLNMELLYLPPYKPELNPIESLWSVVKRNIK